MNTKAKMGLLLAWTVLAVLGGSWYSQRNNRPASPPGSRRVLYYRDPMHPSYRSDQPGIAPDCGMQLEPVYADGAVAPSMPPGTISISSEKQQIMGVRVAPVARTGALRMVRLLGRVAADEDRIYGIVAGAEGWVRTLNPSSAGTVVKKDDILATFYGTEFLSAQQSYFFVLSAMDRFKQGGQDNAAQLKLTNSQIRTAEDTLQSLGMSELQMQEIAKTREAARDIAIRSPADGLVLARNITRGLRFQKDTVLYRIAELGRVWVQADVFENERQWVRPHAVASIHYQGRTLPARVSGVPPQFDAGTRTLKLRLEVENPGYLLRPDMFVDVDLEADLPPALVVPAEAVLDSGIRKTVFVDRGNGYLEPRQVETGWRVGDRVQIVKGLEAGERIVISGNFLIDSEARLQNASARRPGGERMKDPVCGMEVDWQAAAGRSEFKEKAYYFCSTQCKGKFDAKPEQYAKADRGATPPSAAR